MTRPALWTGILLAALGLGIFVWKTVAVGLPLWPSDPEGLWLVEIEVTARGLGDRGSVRAAIPTTRIGQLVFEEHATSDRLAFSTRDDPDVRFGIWRGRFQGVHNVSYAFRVQLSEVRTPLPERVGGQPPEAIRENYLLPTGNFPADAEEVRLLLERLRLPGADDPAGRLRALYAFVSDEVTTLSEAGGDALLTLARREGSPFGTESLLVTLLRASGIPARMVTGLHLREDRTPEPRSWTEAWVGGQWISVSPSEGFFAVRPPNHLVLHTSDTRSVLATGVRAVTHRYQALRERLRPDEIASVMAPEGSWLASVSLYRLPLGTQANLRLLLLLPLGALVTAVYRNLVGFPTFGTFMPALIALALRTSTLGRGLILVGIVLVVGISGRLLLDRLRLLLVPRLSVLLCVVVLSVTALALVGRRSGSGDLFAGLLLPTVILTFLIERFSIAIAEEGMRNATVRFGWSLLVAVSIYPIFRMPSVEHLLFSFPELVVLVMGLLVWIGGYTGYRLTDLLRFRTFFIARGAAP